LREEHRLRVFENRVLRKIFGLKMDEVTGIGIDYIMRSFVTSTAHPNFVRVLKSRRMGWTGHVARMG
jgi:hypothetical protein